MLIDYFIDAPLITYPKLNNLKTQMRKDTTHKAIENHQLDTFSFDLRTNVSNDEVPKVV